MRPHRRTCRNVVSFNLDGEACLPRIPPIAEDSLTPAQREVYEKVIAGPRGSIIGPLRAVLHSPELADRWQSLGEFLRFDSCVPYALRELAIISVGRYWNSELEWLVHARLALEAGISRDVIEAIRVAGAPQFTNADEAAVYLYTRELLQHGNVSEDAYRAIHVRFGTVGTVELTGLVGYYTMVAMTLNAHEVPLPSLATPIPPLAPARTSSLPQPTPLAPGRVAGKKHSHGA
jgi:4-carboxymuconolactone decarboxylase